MTEWSSTSLLADRDPEWRQVLKSNLRQIDWSESLQGIVDKILDDEVLTKQDGLSLFSEPNLFELGQLALLHKKACFHTEYSGMRSYGVVTFAKKSVLAKTARRKGRRS